MGFLDVSVGAGRILPCFNIFSLGHYCAFVYGLVSLDIFIQYIYYNPLYCIDDTLIPLKRQCHEICCFWFFHGSSSPKPLAEIFASQGATTPVANTGNKIKLLTP
jgi:hypothetical protein